MALTSLLTVAALSTTGCNGLVGGSAEGDDKGPIVLGMAIPMSGSSAAIGPYMKNGAQLAIDEINAKGGVLGRKLELQAEDDACDPKTAVAGGQQAGRGGRRRLGRRLLLGRHAADAADLRQGRTSR